MRAIESTGGQSSQLAKGESHRVATGLTHAYEQGRFPGPDHV